MAQLEKETVKLFDFESDTGKAKELEPADKARLSIARGVLWALALIFLGAAVGLLYGPDCRLEQSQAIFDFVKTIVPPIATLVIGFYFRNESA
jgi:hypothetical protein